MRLINVRTLELKEFLGAANTPPYAILSHTWTVEEVTFQEWELWLQQSLQSQGSVVERKSGWSKIVSACRRAQADRLDWLWCDTNCIDKRSSAELSEAINSMFAWYHDAEVCYAFLEDVEKEKPESFAKSRWFTRGWTLQELLAPSKVIFFDHRWSTMGDRKILAGEISRITRIHVGALNDRLTIHGYSVAQRMSWAADRQTTRSEDIAYCLLGIFDINMPLLYGEGPKAFYRLQEEIIRVSDDQSILAWDWLNSQDQPLTPVLAQSPAYFRSCGSIIRDTDIGSSPYSITNLGLSIEVPIIYTFVDWIVLVGLNCSRKLHGRVAKGYNGPKEEVRGSRRSQVWIWLRLRPTGQDTYERTHVPSTKTFLDDLYTNSVDSSVLRLFLATTLTNMDSRALISRPWQLGRIVDAAGFTLTVGFGILRPRTLTYEKAYLPGNFSVTPLKQRGYSTLSHELVSDGRFGVLLSIAWDQVGHPEKWHHTSFFDRGRKFSSEIIMGKEWRCLFGEREEPRELSGMDNCTKLALIHKHIDQLPNKLQAGVCGQPPFVLIKDETLQDLLGFSQVAVRIVFQQCPQKESIY